MLDGEICGAALHDLHAPDYVPPMREGEPHMKAQAGTAAEFIVKMVHKYPGQVVLWARRV